MLHVDTVPPGAVVRRDGGVLCQVTPCDILLTGADAAKDRVLSLVVQKPSFRPAPIDVKVGDGTVTVKLVWSGTGHAPKENVAPTPSGYKGAY